MGVKKLAAKVEEYWDRLKRGKASKIKASHVEKVLSKLRKRALALDETIRNANDKDKSELVIKKRKVIERLIERAEWLKGRLG